jgi:ribokinase
MSNAAFDVIVYGSLHLDIVVNAPLLPRIDETAVGRAWRQTCGGKGGNQAVQAARAGARTAMIGRVGDDEFGRVLLANLETSGVDNRCVAVDAGTGSGMSVAIVQDDGEYGAVIVSGANQTVEKEDLPGYWSQLGGGRVLVLQNEVPHAANMAAAEAARASGAMVLYNAAPAREVDDLLGLVDILVVNRVEAEALTGRSISNFAAAKEVILELWTPQHAVVVTLGGEGLVVADQTGHVTVIAPVPVKVTSTHGAGDCFVGTFATQLASGVPLLQACGFANGRAAAFVSRGS